MNDHHRVTPTGRALGKALARIAELGRARLRALGLADVGLSTIRDAMCSSCACRPGTVPNGCLQTQLDLLKAVTQGDMFLCHAPKDGRACAGWVAARAEHAARPLPPQIIELAAGWEYSPPDEDTDVLEADQAKGEA